MILDFFPYKTQLRNSKQSLEHSHGSPEFPNQNLRQIGRRVSEFLSDIQTNKQTEIINLYTGSPTKDETLMAEFILCVSLYS